MPRFRPLALFVALVLVFHVPLVRAHDPFVAEIGAEAGAETLTVRLTFARSVAAHLAGLSAGPRLHYAPERFAADHPAFVAAAPGLLVLEHDGRSSTAIPPAAAELIDEDADVVFVLVYPRPSSATQVRLASPWLARLPAAENYVATFVLKSGDALLAGPLLVSNENPAVDFSLPARDGTATTRDTGAPASSAEPPAAPNRIDGRGFFKLGVEHILTGYDHLLYLAALILGCTGLRAIFGIVTAFTLSHSLTLALATLGLVSPPSVLVEQIIASSIVFVAVENLWLRGRAPRWRHLIAFGFGLVHGFGFAGLLAELGVGAKNGAVVVPLLTFNLGVEAGQLLIIAAVLPLLLRVRRHAGFVRYGQPAASVAVAALGLVWLIQRL